MRDVPAALRLTLTVRGRACEARLVPTLRFFVYGSLMSGEPDHARLGGAGKLASVRTKPGYSLVEVGALAALVAEGSGTVLGELYELDGEAFRKVALSHDYGSLYRVDPVELEDGTRAQAFTLPTDQVRGKRRIESGDWRGRFAARNRPEPSAFVKWARTRPR